MSQSEESLILEGDPFWYKDAIIYEVHVRAFADSDDDGIGDFRGLTSKLDYLQDLGVTALWLLPFYPSPLKDDGYDIADYTDVHPSYGTLRDFHTFLQEAHRRGIRVITELVLNHTSDRHPWFQRARRARPGSRWRDFYVWSDTPQKYTEARIIFKDFEPSNWAWDPVAKAYYWHRFYAHQPDLNFDHPPVQRAMLQVMDFWFGMGVDGLRLDAVPYLYEREGTNCENLPETHAFLKELRLHIDQKFRDRMLLAEANQWPEDATAYFGDGDECHMAFHFPLMPRMFMATRMENRFPVIDILQQTPAIPESCQWALFLRNHDELTLEMVTDEERDYMYRVYASDPQTRVNLGIRRRLAPLLGNDRRLIELMNGLRFSLPGTPVIYYGGEIGMGDNIYLGDRNAVRTPMQWSADRNAGFSRANPQKLFLPVIIDPEYHYEAVNVEAQQNNLQSLLWWMKRLISHRKHYQVFGRGSLEFLYPENRKVLAYVRRYKDECILVVANLSRFAQCVELDLAAFQGRVPVELFGGTRFPPIGELPYLLTLGSYAFFWFTLDIQYGEATVTTAPREAPLPSLTLRGSWETILRGKTKARLEAVLPGYLRTRRWFGGKARSVQSTQILEAIPMPTESPLAYIILAQVEYTDGEPEIYVLPLAFGPEDQVAQGQDKQQVVARLRLQGKGEEQEGVLYEVLGEKGFSRLLLEAVARHRQFKGEFGRMVASHSHAFRALLGSDGANLEPAVLKAEQSNSSIVYGNRFILKLFRRLEAGLNPDLEIGRFLTEQREFTHVPTVAGALEYRRGREEPRTLAILNGFVPNEGDAWSYTLDALGHYFERVLARPAEVLAAPLPCTPLLAQIEQDLPPPVSDFVATYLEDAYLLGQRTAECHVALASEPDDPNFAPEPFTDFYRRSLYHAMLSLADEAFQLLRRRLLDLPEAIQEDARRALELEPEARRRFRSIRDRKITAMRIRCHGDYHLGQVLHTGKDFVIIDFEGEPARPLSERRIKRSPLRDVAGMLRSFHYASYAALLGHVAGVRQEDLASSEPLVRFWYLWVSVAFLKAYLAVARPANLLPQGLEELQVLLDAHLLEKAVYELFYELNNRPEWVGIPLRGILQLLETTG